MTEPREVRVAGLFAGVGGIELGLEQLGMRTELLCELEPGARRTLERRFAGVELHDDVATLDELPDVQLLTAGFPCQDLSQAGSKTGIRGQRSGVVEHVFRLLRSARDAGRQPSMVLLENVSYMLRLDGGRGMAYLVEHLEELGYAWAYRVVDARSFGVPQRRQRVVLLASLDADPAPLILGESAEEPEHIDAIGPVSEQSVYGFYWTEGRRGLGWARDALPTLKGGSRLGIPSPPAVWQPTADFFGTPALEDAERLQGFDAGWTEPADEVYEKPRRWRWTLVGNAVCVPMAKWVGRRIQLGEVSSDPLERTELQGRWPRAAFGHAGQRYAVEASMRPEQSEFVPLASFLAHPLHPLSDRAARGFLSRAQAGRLRFGEGFLDSLERYLDGAGSIDDTRAAA